MADLLVKRDFGWQKSENRFPKWLVWLIAISWASSVGQLPSVNTPYQGELKVLNGQGSSLGVAG